MTVAFTNASVSFRIEVNSNMASWIIYDILIKFAS